VAVPDEERYYWIGWGMDSTGSAQRGFSITTLQQAKTTLRFDTAKVYFNYYGIQNK
jgi:hypothetical protein